MTTDSIRTKTVALDGVLFTLVVSRAGDSVAATCTATEIAKKTVIPVSNPLPLATKGTNAKA